MKETCEKNRYIRPKVSICNVETVGLIAGSNEAQKSAFEDFGVSGNTEKTTNIWGN